MSADVNSEYSKVFPTSCTLVPFHHIQSFREYLQTIPFNFSDYQPPIFGCGLETEGDVRLFLEPAAVLACWPIAVSMVPTNRNVDYALRSEKALQNRNRPDISIFENPIPGSVAPLRALVAIEFKGPNVLDLCRNGVPTVDCDAWDHITSQARKYAADNRFKHIIVFDGVYGIYLGFSDPWDVEANVDIIMINVSGGPVGFPYQVTARELILFAFYQSFGAVSDKRDFSGVTVPAHTSTDYVDISPSAVTPFFRSLRSESSSRVAPRRSAPHLTCLQLPSGQFPACEIESSDLTPLKVDDSGFLSSRRTPNSHFLGRALRRVTMDVGSERGRLLMSDPDQEQATTPPPTSQVVIKEFIIDEILKANQEATAYYLLKRLQGYTIPFCYGVYTVDTGRVALLLEKIKGEALNDRLSEVFSAEPIDMDKVKSLFMSCRHAIESLHNVGIAHRDISGENILVLEKGDAILVDLENSLPINSLSRKLDYRCLRLSFAQFGVEESVLRSWC